MCNGFVRTGSMHLSCQWMYQGNGYAREGAVWLCVGLVGWVRVLYRIGTGEGLAVAKRVPVAVCR